MAKSIKILGLAGSARQDSHNWALLRTMSKLTPSHVELVVYTEVLPLAMDFEMSHNPDRLGKAYEDYVNLIKSSDRVLFSTPQFSFEIPRIMQAIIDLGHPNSQTNFWQDKIFGVIGASMDTTGGKTAVSHLSNLAEKLGMKPSPTKPLYLTNVSKLFDETGTLTDPTTLKDLTSYLKTFSSN